MRGNPFLQAVLIFVVFLLAGVPIYRLTRPAEATTDNPPETLTTDRAPAKPVPLDVEVVFAPAPADFQITNLGQPVLAGHGPHAKFAGRWIAAVPPEGVDLVIQAHWSASANADAGKPPGADPGAMRVIVRFPGGRTADKTLWADANGALDDVFTVPGDTTTPPAATP